MAKKKAISKETFVTAATDMLNGKSIRQVTNEYAISERDSRWLSRNLGLCADEFRDMVIDRLRILMADILDKIHEKLDQIPAASLSISFGILSDKMQNFTTEIQSQTPQFGLQLRGKILTEEEVEEILTTGSLSSKKKCQDPKHEEPPIIGCTVQEPDEHPIIDC